MSERYVDVVPTRQRELVKLLGYKRVVLYAGRRTGAEIGATHRLVRESASAVRLALREER